VLEKFHKHYLGEAPHLPFADCMQQSFKQARENWKDRITKEQLIEAYAIMVKYLTLVTEQPKEDAPEILNIEKKIWITIDDEFIFYGFIDRVQRDKDGMLHVLDYKSTKDPKYLKDRTQLLLYGYSLLVEDDKLQKLRSSYLLLKHDLKPMLAEHNPDELIAAKNAFAESWRKITCDKLFRPTPIFYKCNMCDYITHCKEGQKLIFSNKKTYGKIKW
jgi:RecB family exonuclease